MRLSGQAAPTAATVLIGASIALAGCFTQYTGAGGEFEEDPRQGLPERPPVVVSVERVGLEGYVSPDTPTVVRYRVLSRGPARRVILELHEWPPPKDVPWSFTVAANTPPLELDLAAGEERAGPWILPQFASYNTMHAQGERAILLLVRDRGGALLGATEMPEVKHAYWPVAVIAGGTDAGLAIQEAVHRADLGQGPYPERREVALLLGEPPDLWYEYGAAGSVILARPWSELSPAVRSALRRHVAFGGTMHVLPEHCPDWRDADPTTGAAPGLQPTRYGAGKVFVEPATTDGDDDGRELWLARTLPGRDHAGTGWSAVNPPLGLVYVMPDAALLVALILLIVVLVGPVAHLVLVRLRRREWSWVAVPALSVALAGCMYAVASGVKGEESALEVHYLVHSFGDANDAAVSAAIRVQSAEAGVRSVRARGEQPRASNVSFGPFGSEPSPRDTRVTPSGVVVAEIPMHRFSSHDLGLTFATQRRDVLVTAIGDDGVRVVNRTGAPLTDLYLERPAGWIELAERLGPGQTIERRGLGLGTPEHELFGDAPQTSEALDLVGVLGAATARRSVGSIGDFALVAGCDASGLPEVETSPKPAVTKVRATCAWVVTP